MPSNTAYNPTHTNDFEKSKLAFDGQGVNVTVTAGQTANLDYTLTDDCLLTGVEVIIGNGNYGDTGNLQIVDSGGLIPPPYQAAYPNYPVLDQFGTNWNFAPTTDETFQIVYPAKIVTGMTIRLVYTSTGTNNVFVGINYMLHKCLV